MRKLRFFKFVSFKMLNQFTAALCFSEGATLEYDTERRQAAVNVVPLIPSLRNTNASFHVISHMGKV